MSFNCLFSLPAVGVHQDGGGESSGKDLRRQISKVSITFNISALDVVFQKVLFEMIIITDYFQTLPMSTSAADQQLQPSGRPVSPRVCLRGRYCWTLKESSFSHFVGSVFRPHVLPVVQGGTTSSVAVCLRPPG